MGHNVDISVNLNSIGIYDTVSPKIVSAVQSAIYTSLSIIRDKWQTEAQNALHSTLPQYLMGLQWDSVTYPYNNSAFSGAVILKGKFPNMLEVGFGAFDQKLGFSKSKKIHRKKDGGWYLTIPIRHSTPGGYMFGSPMPKDIYGVAKKLGNGESLKVAGAGDLNWNGYQRKSNQYDGLTRIIKSYQKAKQSQYYTFRRVSDKSDPSSWMHPGYKGVHIAKNIENFARDTFVSVLNHNLSTLK